MRKVVNILLCLLPLLFVVVVSWGSDFLIHGIWNSSQNTSDLIFELVMIAVCAIIYYGIFKKNKPLDFMKQTSLLSYGNVAIISLGLLVIVSIAEIVIMLVIFLGFEEYNDVHAQVMGTIEIPKLWLIVYVLGPIMEEYLCRGVMLRLAQRVTIRFWIANIIQAAFFGVLHMNLVKGVFLFAVGLFLGWIYRKYNCLLPTIVAHIAYNLLSYVVTKIFIFPSSLYIIFVEIAIYALLAILLVMIGVKLINSKDRPVVNGETVFMKNYMQIYKEANFIKKKA